MNAAAIVRRRARSTGTVVALYRATYESDPSIPWETVCEDHGGIVCHPTRRIAEGWLSHPEDWCPSCSIDSCEVAK